MSDYTPGPWQIQKYVNYEGWSIWGSEDGCIAERWYASPRDNSENARMQANAALIAAAPDLLAAAEEVMGRSYLISPVTGRQLCVECSVYVGEEHSADCYIPALTAAIKKAKGQQ